RKIAGSLEHTAPLAPGSSGDALLDADGRLVGLNTNRIGEGFYLALPADAALRERIDALGRGESPSRRRLGVAVAPALVAPRPRRSVVVAQAGGLPWRGHWAVRSGCRSVTACWCVVSRPAARPPRRASSRAT